MLKRRAQASCSSKRLSNRGTVGSFRCHAAVQAFQSSVPLGNLSLPLPTRADTKNGESLALQQRITESPSSFCWFSALLLTAGVNNHSMLACGSRGSTSPSAIHRFSDSGHIACLTYPDLIGILPHQELMVAPFSGTLIVRLEASRTPLARMPSS